MADTRAKPPKAIRILEPEEAEEILRHELDIENTILLAARPGDIIAVTPNPKASKNNHHRRLLRASRDTGIPIQLLRIDPNAAEGQVFYTVLESADEPTTC